MSKSKSKTPPKELPRPSLRTKLLGGVCAKALDAGMGMHNQVVDMAHEQSKALLKAKYGR